MDTFSELREGVSFVGEQDAVAEIERTPCDLLEHGFRRGDIGRGRHRILQGSRNVRDKREFFHIFVGHRIHQEEEGDEVMNDLLHSDDDSGSRIVGLSLSNHPDTFFLRFFFSLRFLLG